MSINPGVTYLFLTEIVSLAAVFGISLSITAMRPSAIATSRMAFNPWTGSMTVPPLSSISYFTCYTPRFSPQISTWTRGEKRYPFSLQSSTNHACFSCNTCEVLP